MHKPHLTEPGRVLTDTIDPGAEFRTVCVGAVAVDHDDFRPQRDLLAEDPDHRTSLHDTAPEGMLGLEPDDEHRVSLIRCALCELSLIHISEPTRLLSISYA